MELVSLWAFTLLGGLAAGLYLWETLFGRKRSDGRTYVCPVAVCIVFAIGMIAAATHINGPIAIFRALSAGTLNLGSGMMVEVALSGTFLVLTIIDALISLAKRVTPSWLRVVTAAVATAVLISMGTAYIHIYGNPIWSIAWATVPFFVSGALVMGSAALAVAMPDIRQAKAARMAELTINIAYLACLLLEIAAFCLCGTSPALVVIGMLLAPVCTVVALRLIDRIANPRTSAIVVFALAVAGVAIARFAFYSSISLFL